MRQREHIVADVCTLGHSSLSDRKSLDLSLEPEV